MKRYWKDHPTVGLMINVKMADGPVPCKIVDAKAGPMTFDPRDMERPDLVLRGTIKLRVKTPGGTEMWLPPVDGEAVCTWADKQRAENKKEDAA